MAESAVNEARRRLGRFGAGLMIPLAPADEWRRAAVRVEEAGYGSVWVNEAVGGREAFTHLGMLLAATGRLVAGTGVANVWARHPATAQGAAAGLADAFPGRFVLGAGVSMSEIAEGSGQEWRPPLQHMREYLDRMDDSAEQAPRPDVPFPRILAALGPKMMGLARDRADGAIPATMPVEHTRRAREILGPDKLLVVMQGVILETDPSAARSVARSAAVRSSAPGSPYRRALLEMGYTDADLENEGSDELIDARFPWGDEAAIVAKLQAHLDAGADHICVNVFAPDLASTAEQFERLSPALKSLV